VTSAANLLVGSHLIAARAPANRHALVVDLLSFHVDLALHANQVVVPLEEQNK